MSQKQEYKDITREEFESFLQSCCYYKEFYDEFYNFDFLPDGEGWKKAEGAINEHCYFVVVDLEKNQCLKIYSSVDRRDGTSRAPGKDAIRVVAASAETAEPIRGTFPIVKRIWGWRKNLRTRMSEALKSLGKDTICPLCKKDILVFRKSEEGEVFLGCSDFRTRGCKGSRSL